MKKMYVTSPVDILKKDLLKVKELIHYVNFVADDNSYKRNKLLTFLEYIENHNTFKQFLKTDSELILDDDLMLKFNRIVIPGDHQNHFIPLAH